MTAAAVMTLTTSVALAADPDVVTIERISEAPGGVEADGQTLSVSAVGDRFIALGSEASNFVADDTNGVSDVFVLDLSTGSLERVSVTTDGGQADGQSYSPSIDAAGRYVVFTSEAANLASDSCAVCADVYLHDRQTGETRHLSAISNPAADDASYQPRISADGEWVVFESLASELVPGDTNGVADIFLYEVATGDLTRVSTMAGGGEADAPSLAADISATGEWIAFASVATLVPHNIDPTCEDIEFETCRNVYMLHRPTGALTLVTRDVDGNGPNGSSGATLDFGSLEIDGGWVLAFTSTATDLMHPTGATGLTVPSLGNVFVAENRRTLADPDAIEIERFASGVADPERSAGLAPVLSPDARFVAFLGESTDAGGSIFVADRATRLVRRLVDQAPSINRSLGFPADTRDVLFVSGSDVLVADDVNGWLDAFLARWTPFLDIVGNFFEVEIRWMSAEGVTRGCRETDYCPSVALTRAQAASFFARFLGLAPSSSDRFTDDDASVHEGSINALADLGVTRGCAPGLFCPDDPLGRAQLASLIARALDLSGAGPNAFMDDELSIHELAINRLADAGITEGCAADRFCPGAPVRRDQMAGFLFRAARLRA